MEKTPQVARRTNNVGTPMLVNLPNAEERECNGWHDTGEGGLAFFLLIPSLWYVDYSAHDKASFVSRQACVAGGVWWPPQDCQVGVVGGAANFHVYGRNFGTNQHIDGGLLIGSTGESLYSDKFETYFMPTYNDLTDEGKALYDMLYKLYCEPISNLNQPEILIATLLDT